MEPQSTNLTLASGDAKNSSFRRPQRPITLKFEDVVYKIKTKKNKKVEADGCTISNEKLILKGVSGVVLPGEMAAMMGPSGSGKTTLLTALGGRIKGGTVTGSITYNNRPFSAAMKRAMGFVAQDDVLHPHLTVRETLVYTALLRLQRTLTWPEKAAQADDVMEQLGLSHCRNSAIGGPLVRGISGGERKRVSIGQELLVDPSLIFLDEPTSGLDSTTAQRIVSTLWELAKAGRTVVMTIHQPSSSLFYMFDRVLLLSDGYSVYFGRASDAMDYFAGVGYTPSVSVNPSDFILDLASGTADTLVVAYAARIQPTLKSEMDEITRQCSTVDDVDRGAGGWNTTWWEQFTILVRRELRERSHDSFSGLKIVQTLLVAVLVGLLWWQSQGHVQDQVGLLFFVNAFWAFDPLYNAIFTFPQERTLLEKERSSGMYRLSSYFIARTTIDLPMELILPAAFMTIVYWMCGLKPTATSFVETLLIILIGVLVSSGLGLALGAVILKVDTASTTATVLSLSFMLAAGFFVQKVPAFIAWIKYISLLYYTFKLSAMSQFSASDTYKCESEGICSIMDIPSIKLVGLDKKWLALASLFIMVFGYRLVAYTALMRIGNNRG